MVAGSRVQVAALAISLRSCSAGERSQWVRSCVSLLDALNIGWLDRRADFPSTHTAIYGTLTDVEVRLISWVKPLSKARGR